MTSEKSEDKEKKAKKEGKKKEKRSVKEGVHKSKKDKKDKPTTNGGATSALLETLAVLKPDPKPANGEDVVMTDPPVIKALVPFANPLADEKVQKKVLKSVKKAAKNRSIKRGVKEVVKALRRAPTTGAGSSNPWGIVVLAADISPMDVISHIPVLCEDHKIPYIYVTSRAELGAAGSTKRPTSVVLINPDGRPRKPKKNKDGTEQPEADKKKGDEEEEDFKDVYKTLAKVVEKESRNVRI